MKKVTRETSPPKKSPLQAQSKPSVLNLSCEDKTRIYVRVRPLLKHEALNTSLKIKDKYHIRTIKSDFEVVRMKFDGVFSSESLQKDVFATFEPSIRGFLNGESHCFFAYGQTGAGKTYTMMGDFAEDATDFTRFLTSESRGILPRALSEILNYIQNRRCRLWAAFYEIYNDKIYDLLNAKINQKKGGLDFRENPNGYNTIVDLQQFEINSVSDMLECLRVGLQNRVTGSTHGNSKSSRSHSIFQLKLVQGDPQERGKTMISQLKIIDLAGSEKFVISKDLTPEEKELRITELTSINGSLSTLGLCISALTDPKRSHIPLRNSKLTRVLSDTLNGSSKIAFIVCISPSFESNNETLSTLQFACRAKKIVLEGRPTSKASKQLNLENGMNHDMCNINVAKNNMDLETEIRRLREQNEELKDRLKKLGGSCSPQRTNTRSNSNVKMPVKTPNARSVSPYSSGTKNRRESPPKEKSVQTLPRTSDIKRSLNSPQKGETEPKNRNKEKNMNSYSKESGTSLNKATVPKTVGSQQEGYHSKDSYSNKVYNNPFQSHQEADVLIQQPLNYSTGLQRPKETQGWRQDENYYPMPQAQFSDVSFDSNSKVQQALSNEFGTHPDAFEPFFPISNSTQGNNNRQNKISTPKNTVVNLSGKKTPDRVNQQAFDSISLNDWTISQDSRYIKEDEQLGLPNNEEISSILINPSRSGASSVARGIIGSRRESEKKIEDNIKSPINLEKSQNSLDNDIVFKIINGTVDDSGEANKSSKDFANEEVINEFNRKLYSLHQLNEKHQHLIKDVTTKLEEAQMAKKNESTKPAQKSPGYAEKQKHRREVSKLSSTMKKELVLTIPQKTQGLIPKEAQGMIQTENQSTPRLNKHFDSSKQGSAYKSQEKQISTPNVGTLTSTNITSFVERDTISRKSQ